MGCPCPCPYELFGLTGIVINFVAGFNLCNKGNWSMGWETQVRVYRATVDELTMKKE